MDDLYRSELMEIYKDPAHKGRLSNPSLNVEKQNAFCGDHLHLNLKIKNNIIEDAKFEGSLCFVSIVGAELLIDEIIGKTITEVKKIDQKKLLELINLNLSTSRIACATLTLKALHEALDEYEQNKN
jgi:nitrogen fixation NifU-like protein